MGSTPMQVDAFFYCHLQYSNKGNRFQFFSALSILIRVLFLQNDLSFLILEL